MLLLSVLLQATVLLDKSWVYKVRLITPTVEFFIDITGTVESVLEITDTVESVFKLLAQ